MRVEPCARCGAAAAIEGSPMCGSCTAQGPLSPEEARRWRLRLEEDREDWPVHRPEAVDAPIPGRHWYAGCEPGGDWDSELGRYTGTGPKVDPATGICVGCGEKACPECGRENCPDHEQVPA